MQGTEIEPDRLSPLACWGPWLVTCINACKGLYIRGAFPVCPMHLSKAGLCFLHPVQPCEFVALERDEQFLSRFHQGEASFGRTQVCRIARVYIQKESVARAAAVGESWNKCLSPGYEDKQGMLLYINI